MELNLALYNKMLEEIKKDLYPLVEVAGKYKNMSLNALKNYLNANDKINIVMVGPNSVGKSTIIKNLTGVSDIKTGQGVVTNSSMVYEWEDMCLIDTPGVGTELYREHDLITQEAIKNADLLLFVVTNELFDNQSGNYFRELAEFKANEMFLVINKMNRVGNDEIKQETMKKSINEVVYPLLAEDYYTTFIDSVDYGDSLLEKDEEYKGILAKRSGYDNFIENLNKFIMEKSLYVDVTTSTRKIICVIDELIEGVVLKHNDDNYLNDIVEAKNNREKLETEKFLIFDNINYITNDTSIKIKNIGYQCANEIFMLNDNDLIKKCLQRFEQEVNSVIESSNSSIVRFLECEYNDMLQIKGVSDTIENNCILKYGSKINNRLGCAAQAVQAINGKGAAVLKTVITGEKTWLFSANKLASKIKLGGIGFQIFSLGVGLVLDIVEEDQRKNKLKQRQDLIDRFYEFANTYRGKIMDEVKKYIEDNYDSEIEKYTLTIRKITDEFKNDKKICDQLENVRKDALKLINLIHSKESSVI